MNIIIGLGLVFFAAINGLGQTTLISKAEWMAVMKGVAPAPPAPYRMIVKVDSFDDGDLVNGYTSLMVSEHFSRTNSRFSRKERIGTKFRSEEYVYIGKETFSRKDDGQWVAARLPSSVQVVRSQDDPVNPRFIRKQDSDEILLYSLGDRPYKGQIVAVYEEVTRHVLIRTADNGEIHYENRMRFWIAKDKMKVRQDKYYAIFSPEKTSRQHSSHEWEKSPDLKPFTAPITK